MKNTLVFVLAIALLAPVLSPLTVEAKTRKHSMKPRHMYEYMTQSAKNEIRCMDARSKCPDWRSK